MHSITITIAETRSPVEPLFNTDLYFALTFKTSPLIINNLYVETNIGTYIAHKKYEGGFML